MSLATAEPFGYRGTIIARIRLDGAEVARRKDAEYAVQRSTKHPGAPGAENYHCHR
jgi:hypothetical protein